MTSCSIERPSISRESTSTAHLYAAWPEAVDRHRRGRAHLSIRAILRDELAIARLRVTIAAAVRRRDHVAVAFADGRDDLRRDLLLAALGAVDHRARHRAGAAAFRSRGGAEVTLAAMGEDDLALEHLVLADDAEPAA